MGCQNCEDYQAYYHGEREEPPAVDGGITYFRIGNDDIGYGNIEVCGCLDHLTELQRIIRKEYT